MAQMTDSLAQAILNGDGVTRNEVEQLCRHWLATSAAVQVQAEPLRWKFIGIAGLKRYLTEKQYQAQTPAVKKWYAPICDRCGPAAPQGDAK